MVRRADRHRVDAVRPGFLPGDHRVEIAIGALRLDTLSQSEGPPPFRVNVEGSGQELKGAVEAACDAMDIADIGALSAANHAEAQRRRYFPAHERTPPMSTRWKSYVEAEASRTPEARGAIVRQQTRARQGLRLFARQ